MNKNVNQSKKKKSIQFNSINIEIKLNWNITKIVINFK